MMIAVKYFLKRSHKLSPTKFALYTCLWVFFTGCASLNNNTKTAVSSLNTEVILIKNVTVVDVINKNFLANQNILIRDGKIASISKAYPKPGVTPQVINGEDLIAMPGFVNTHTHLWQHLTRSLQATAILQDWVKVIYPYAHYIRNDRLERITYIAARQAQLSGITTVSDFASVNFQYGSLEATFKGLSKANMGGFVTWWHPAVFLPPDLRKLHFEQTVNKAKEYGLGLSMGFGPLSFMPLPAVYDGIQLGLENSVLLSEHTMENLTETRDFQKAITNYVTEYKDHLKQNDLEVLRAVINTPVLDSSNLVVRAKRNLAIANNKPASEGVKVPSMYPLLYHLEALNKFLAIHSVWLNEEDLKIMNQTKASVSHNPESNMYLASGAAPLLDYKRAEIPITMGTDGAASNDRIDMFTAMRSAANLLKVSRLNAKQTAAIDSWAILQAATINGARALGLDRQTGSLSVGKEADIILLSKKRLSASPFSSLNNAAILVNSASTRDVHTVLSNGHVVVENFSLKPAEEASLSQELNQLFNTINTLKETGITRSYPYIISSNPIIAYFSVRKKDAIDLSFNNGSSAESRFIRIMMSAQPFGGATAVTLAPETLNRFPLNNDFAAFDKKFLLKPNEKITILKSKGNYDYIIKTPQGDYHYTGKSGQISITTSSQN
ncbi:amidohydrolase family protein [Ascidiimonas sp. W6]|uniref:amidohydrolase family protein n=1 Tax=Ascidiimonas meishanensis TaxID=3128903 RepID=UPI0030EC997B